MKEYINKLYKNSKETYFKEMDLWLRGGNKKIIVTVNPETLMLSEKNDNLKKLMDSKCVSLVPDGIAVVKASKWVKSPVLERITGVEISEELLVLANKNKYSLYLLGAKEEVVSCLANKIKVEYPSIKLLGFSNGYVKNLDKEMEKISKLKPDILLVALGIPMQEELIYRHMNEFNKGIIVGVGGSFDVLSGTKKRAPKIFIKLNLEWLYRIIKEPSRLKRFWNNNVKFIFKVRKEK